MTTENQPQAKPSSAFQTFLHRSFSSVILVCLLVGIYLINNPWAYLGFVAILTTITSLEWIMMMKQSKIQGSSKIIVGSNILFFILAGIIGFIEKDFYILYLPYVFILLFAIIAAFTWELRKPVEGLESFKSLSVNIISFIYPNWMFLICLPLLFSAEYPLVHFVLWVIIVTKVMDIGAYVSGSLFGKHKMIPHISPKKTWEGFIGAVIITVVTGTLSAYFLGDKIEYINKLPLFVVAFLSLGIGLVSVVGDLAGSFIKRALGVKDSGKILPGIGGVFDLIDSPAFTLPLAVLATILINA